MADFDALLIANRGEIACRIIETARRMGLRTVAVYSDADRDARHVAMADEAVRIGPAEPRLSYLDGGAIIDAARRTGAGAIHPGYGFLSEAPDFVEDVEAAGLVFVGPSADAIRAMGLKDRAKVLMEKAGVPVVPGFHGSDQSDEALTEAAESIGFPVLIKAVAGGGGKGMRAVNDPADFREALTAARSEARGAFGNDAVLVEKLVTAPRHVEVQIFGDGDRAIHLFERDCSLQRRHQKVVEEAPAPGMTAEMRSAMGTAAVRAAEAVGYRGAGTVEFIVDASEGLRPDRFWFMEMNTRLQVEHPVTEAITGIDLVEWQVRVARGEPLPLRQDDVVMNGHAIEIRLYAEDPAQGFLPQIGRITHLRFPQGARVDTGIRQGDEVTPFYDPMIAKLTVHGETRDTALAKLDRALTGTEIDGITTNLAFLGRLVATREFRGGLLDTGLIERHGSALVEPAPPGGEARAIAVTAALGLHAGHLRGFTLWGPLRHAVDLEGQTYMVEVMRDAVVVSVGGSRHEVREDGGAWWVDGRKTRLRPVVSAQSVTVFGPGGGVFRRTDPLDRESGGLGGGEITAPMPGRAIRVFVRVGDRVTHGDRLAILEAMKMEHVLRAELDGVVSDVRTGEGEQVTAGAVLFVLEPDATDGEGPK